MSSIRTTYRTLAFLLIPVLLLVSLRIGDHANQHFGESEHHQMTAHHSMEDHHSAHDTAGLMTKPCCAKHAAQSQQCSASFDCECKVDNQSSEQAVTSLRKLVDAVQTTIQITVDHLLPVTIQKILEPLLKQINGPPIYLLTNAFLN